MSSTALAQAERALREVQEALSSWGADGAGASVGRRVLLHSAVVVRTYAIYEFFCREVVRVWLRILTINRFDCVSDQGLRDLQNVYRNGCGQLLRLLELPRYQGIPAEAIVESLHGFLRAPRDAELLVDAFTTDLPNLRMGDLTRLFNSVRLGDPTGWVAGHSKVIAALGGADTVESYLRKVVDVRNEAAHGDVAPEDVLGISALNELIEVVGSICVSLWEYLLERTAGMKCCVNVGEVVRSFRHGSVVALRSSGHVLSETFVLFFIGHSRAQSARITSLRREDEPLLGVTPNPGDVITLGLDAGVKEGGRAMRLACHDTKQALSL